MGGGRCGGRGRTARCESGGRGVVWGAENGACEAHAEVYAHAVVAHNAVEVSFVGREFKVGEEAEGAERKGEDGRNDALEEPGGVEDSAVAAEGEDKVKGFRRGPAEVGSPVFEHAFVPGVRREKGGCLEAF